MRVFILSPQAESDLEDIWIYSDARWSTDQADAYLDDIYHAMTALAQQRRRGRKCDEIRPGYWRYNVGSHVIFYKEVPIGVDVIRVLHQRMDFRRHI